MTDPNKKWNEEDLEAYLYASDKARLIAMVQEMADCAGASLKKSVEALSAMNIELGTEVIDADDHIDDMEEQIDQECLYSIAMRQPMREDLRFVYAVMKIITDIERIGDQAVNVVLRMKHLLEVGNGSPCPMLPQINEITQENLDMLSKVIKAFEKTDGGIVYEIRPHRKRVHDIAKTSISQLLQLPMTEGATAMSPGAAFVAMWILRHMSRISDHCLNLAEKVSFIATGVSPMTLKRQAQAEREQPKEAIESSLF